MTHPSLEIRIPLSPNRPFLTRLHYFCATLRRNGGPYADAQVTAYIGEDCEPFDVSAQLPWAEQYPLRFRWVDRERFCEESYFATRLQRIADAPEAEVTALIDPDVLVSGPFDDPVRWADESRGFVGRAADYSPDHWGSSWEPLLAEAGVVLRHRGAVHPGWGLEYQTGSPACPDGFFNLGVVFAHANALAAIGAGIWDELALVRRHEDLVRAQKSLCLAIARRGLPVQGMPLRYHFVNSDLWLEAYPREAQAARLWHYLKPAGLDRVSDFDGYDSVAALLARTDVNPGTAAIQAILRPVHATAVAEAGPGAGRAGGTARVADVAAPVRASWVPPALAVVGMHRSGSSLVGYRLQALGLTAGVGDPLPATIDNPSGFAETLQLVALHDDLLAALDASWDAPPDLEPDALARRIADLDDDVVSVVRERLRRTTPAAGPWFVKDPRASFLVGAWDRASLTPVPIVLCVRDPAEVAHSLVLRNGLAPRHALALWFQYTRTAVAQAAGRPAIAVDYAAQLADPDATVRALAQWLDGLGVDLPAELPAAASADGSRRGTDARMRRATGEPVRRDEPSALDDCAALYRGLAAAHLGAVPSVDPAPMPAWVGWELRQASRYRRAAEAAATAAAENRRLSAQLAFGPGRASEREARLRAQLEEVASSRRLRVANAIASPLDALRKTGGGR